MCCHFSLQTRLERYKHTTHTSILPAFVQFFSAIYNVWLVLFCCRRLCIEGVTACGDCRWSETVKYKVSHFITDFPSVWVDRWSIRCISKFFKPFRLLNALLPFYSSNIYWWNSFFSQVSVLLIRRAAGIMQISIRSTRPMYFDWHITANCFNDKANRTTGGRCQQYNVYSRNRISWLRPDSDDKKLKRKKGFLVCHTFQVCSECERLCLPLYGLWIVVTFPSSVSTDCITSILGYNSIWFVMISSLNVYRITLWLSDKKKNGSLKLD